ncbi:MAG: TetR/AcrR family transcriptional regulator [Proteobacteria bacterium]|nr:TetR/AcrR family transcriptional regulator [Pseudomonadota bacterium]MBS0218289.1 TetR/AcrR family transcriptional regulator [Pseudomonadota bacterium]
MTSLAATSKGAATRDAIIERAYEIARFTGLEGLSIGTLAQAVGMSKSGVFAHFGSREDLQRAVLESAATRFGNAVLIPALSEPRGLPRLKAIMRLWFDWGHNQAGSCVLVASVSEYDDRPGPLRDMVMRQEQAWHDALRRAAQQSIDEGHLQPGDVDQYAFELYAIALVVHHKSSLFGEEQSRLRGERAVERWCSAHSA